MRATHRSSIWTVLMVAILFSSGCAVTPAPSTSYDFGEVYVGNTAASGQFTWTNNTANDIEIIGIMGTPHGTIGGADQFAVKPATFTAYTLKRKGTSTPVSFEFTPVRAGAAAASMTPQHFTGRNIPINEVELTGAGIFQVAHGALSITDGDFVRDQVLDFGDVIVPGGQASRKRFKLFNASNAVVPITVQWVNGRFYKIIQPRGPIQVQPWRHVWVTIEFAPRTLGDHNEGVTFIHSTNAANMAGISLSGRSVAPE